MRANGDATLGVIPTGTGNDFAKAAGITLDWEHATLLLADRITAGVQYACCRRRQNERSLFRKRCRRRFRCQGYIESPGPIGCPSGDLVYLLAVFRGMAEGIATPHMRISTDGDVRTGPITLANVASGPWVGGMFKIAPMARNDDGNFDLLIVAPVSRPRILALLPKLMAGKHMGEKEITHEPVTRILIESDEPVDSHLDGEMQPMQKRFEFELLAGVLHLFDADRGTRDRSRTERSPRRVNSIGVIGRPKNRTSQTKLSVGCSNKASPAWDGVTCGRLLAMNIMPKPCDSIP